MSYGSEYDSMGDVTVSVVVPTYNCGDTIERAIDSALGQTLDDLEVLVVDDGSADETGSIVRSYDDDRVQLYVHEENRGGSAARNTGIEHADGEFVAFLDADDEWAPSKLERQVACLRERSDEWVAAYCGYEAVPEGLWMRLRFGVGRLFGSSVEQSEGGEALIDDVLLGEFALGGSSTLIARTEVVEAIDGFDESFPRHQDWEFLIRLLERGKIALVDESLVVKHETYGATPEDLRTAKQRFFETFRAEIDDLQREGHDVVGRHMFDLSQVYLQNGQFRDGLGYLRRSRPNGNLRVLPLALSLSIGFVALLGRLQVGLPGRSGRVS